MTSPLPWTCPVGGSFHVPGRSWSEGREFNPISQFSGLEHGLANHLPNVTTTRATMLPNWRIKKGYTARHSGEDETSKWRDKNVLRHQVISLQGKISCSSQIVDVQLEGRPPFATFVAKCLFGGKNLFST